MRIGDNPFGRSLQRAERNLSFYPSLSGTIIYTMIFGGLALLGYVFINSPSIALLAESRLALLVEYGFIPCLGWLMLVVSSYIIVVYLWAIISRRPTLELSRGGLVCNSFFDRRTTIPWGQISDVRSHEQSGCLVIHLHDSRPYRNRMSLFGKLFAWLSPDGATFTVSPLELGDDADAVLDAIKRYRPGRTAPVSSRRSAH